MNRYLKRHRTDILIVFMLVVFALILRFFRFPHFFHYSHDHDLIGWFIRSIVEDRNLRLIGQETSSHGVFIGPLFYYALVPFYLAFGMHPIAGTYLSGIIAVFSVVSIYIVVGKIFRRETGMIASLIYASSWVVVTTDREVVPTTPAMLWSIWYLYAMHLILRKEPKGVILGAFLLGLVWHINLALGLLLPVLLFAIYLSRKLPSMRTLAWSTLAFSIPMIPFILFELRNDFSQTQAILGNSASGGVDLIDKFYRVVELASKNLANLFAKDMIAYEHNLLLLLISLSLLPLLYFKEKYRKLFFLLILWIALYFVFFTYNSINLSEYYLNGLNIVWIATVSYAISLLIRKNMAGWLIVIVIVINSAIAVVGEDVNAIGLIPKMQLVSAIKEDAKAHGYPCVSVSYITAPGYELGYRYLFYYNKLHVNLPSSGSPVYSIVFPLNKVDRVDETFGALGLIRPEYGVYDQNQVAHSCSGDNSNLTDPLFGFAE